MLLSVFSQALDINLCPRTFHCNTCEGIHMAGGIFNADENFEDGDEFGFTGSFKKKSLIIVDHNTKMQLMNIQRTKKTIIDEQILNNIINENIVETKGLASGIEV